MYAIVNIAGQQFKVEAGAEIFVNRLAAKKDESVAAPAPSVSTEKIASEISDNLEKLIGSEPETKTVSTPAPAKPAARPMHPESATIKFEDLKFGRNYDPTSSK